MVVAGAMTGAEGSAHGWLFVWCCGPLAGIFIVFDYSAPAPNPAGARAKAVPAGDNRTGNKPAAIAGVLQLKTMARPGTPSGSALADSPVEE
jgi:hypothetical protein